MEQILDLHIHSKYARACSPALTIPNIAKACVEKGIDIVATGDFTHPKWMEHLEENLVEVDKTGLYQLSSRPQEGSLSKRLTDKDSSSARTSLGMTLAKPTRFIFGTEIACIYKHKDKVRRVHLLIFAPNLKAAQQFNAALEERGANLRADGRPIIGITAKAVLQICLDIDPMMMVIPAHAWTPWFAVFGSKSGYDTLEECFEELTPVSELSYGQRKLLQIAMAVRRPHRLLMLDEPVAGVNSVLQARIEDLLFALKSKGETMLIVDHDMGFVRRLADQVVALDAGVVIAEGTAEEVLNNAKVVEAYLGA